MPARTHLLIAIIDLYAGTGAYCRLVARGLKRYHGDEFRISLLLLRGRGLLASDHELFDVIHVVGSDVHTDLRRLYETPLHALAFRRRLREIDPAVVLAVGTYANLLVPAVWRGPVVLTAHAHSTAQLGRSRFGRTIGTLMRRRYGGRVIVAPAEGVARDLLERYGADDVRVIPHGVDLDEIRAKAGAPDAPPTPRPYVVSCGRLSAQKDFPTLVHAHALARAGGLAHDLVIVGDGEGRADVERAIAETNSRAHVHLVGHRDNPFPLVRRGDLFVLSSVWEGFGLALVEAMALGLPCVSTDCPSGPADILADAGILVPPSRPKRLADAMLAALKRRDELAAKSLARGGHFALQPMADAYRDVLREMTA